MGPGVCRGGIYAAREREKTKPVPGAGAERTAAREPRAGQTPTGPHTCGPYNAAQRGNNPKHISNKTEFTRFQ